MQRFLIIQAARFGDLLQTKRLLLSLENEGEVHLLVDTSLKDLARIIYPKATVHGFFFHHPMKADTIEANQKTLQDLAATSFTTVYNCNLSGLSTALCRLFEREQIVGYRPNTQGYTERSPLLQYVARMTKHRAFATLNLVDVWGHFVAKPIAAQRVNPVPQGKGNGLAVVLAGREARRSLPTELLANLIALYTQLKDCRRIFLLGTAGEKKAAYAVRKLIPASLQSRIEDLCGKTNWQDLSELLASADLVVTPDTGTMHLAAHLGTPIRAFFLSSAFCHETGPYGTDHRIFQVQPPCAPCLEKEVCRHDLLCHKTLQNRSFLRAITALEQGNNDIELPESV
ncbi:MAG: glycosyltransferase family 9 protein, partial [Desulfovibrio sp.]|nr:glycosyltransferase family 9 protein [Desulfovibrio sp.]